MHAALYTALRIAFWMVGVGIAAIPAMTKLSEFDLNILAHVNDLNADGHVPELLFVIVPSAGIAVVSALDFLIYDHGQHVGPATTMLTIAAALGNLASLSAGILLFMTHETGTTLNAAELDRATFVLFYALSFSLFSESVISARRGYIRWHIPAQPRRGGRKINQSGERG